MGAIAAAVTALVALRGDLEVIAPRAFYSETRELLQGLCRHVTIVPFAARARPVRAGTDVSRILLIDSCVAAGFDEYRAVPTDDVAAVVFDTTCYWQRSARIRRVVD
jgi:hypothetical protein